jgi:hypothetical protein
VVTQPAQQPPGPGGDRSTGVVITNHVDIRIDTEARKRSLGIRDIRQWMSPAVRRYRAGQIGIQVCVDGAGNVTLEVRFAARPGCHEVESAVDDAQPPVSEAGRQFGRAGQQPLPYRSAQLSIPEIL